MPISRTENTNHRMIYFGVRLHPPLAERLKRLAKKNGWTPSFILREALKLYLNHIETPKTEATSR